MSIYILIVKYYNKNNILFKNLSEYQKHFTRHQKLIHNHIIDILININRIIRKNWRI